MTISKHTPGPWRFSNLPTYVIAGEGYGETIANLGENDGNWKADAALIAAAPELLEALDGLVAVVEIHPEWQEESLLLRKCLAEARAAIGKATGGAQ